MWMVLISKGQESLRLPHSANFSLANLAGSITGVVLLLGK